MLRRICLLFFLILIGFRQPALGWGFFGHRLINTLAVFLLPEPMLPFYKASLPYLSAHATDADMRRYIVAEEGPRHYIDLDHYGAYPFDSLPHAWADASDKFGADSLRKHGIVPWHILTMKARLTRAFSEKNRAAILKNSADIGHYIADAHVPLHTSSNHNGQYTNQHGIHGFWESRIPELLAEENFDLFNSRAIYLENPSDFIWKRVLESAAAVDSVLGFEKKLHAQTRSDQKYAFEERNGKLIRQYSSRYTRSYNQMLDGMVERRMRLAAWSIACFWYTAWVDAGQPGLDFLNNPPYPKTNGVALLSPEAAADTLLPVVAPDGPMLGRSED